nr:KS1 protein-like [Aegilops tauschii subsp. strangulata]
MSEGSDSQNRSEEQVNLSEATSPSNNSYDEGSRSTPSNLAKVATRQRKKKTSESEDEDFVAGSDFKDKSSEERFTIEQSDDDEATKDGKKKKRARTTTAKVLGKPSMRRSDDEEEEEEEAAAPPPKSQKLMGDAIRSGAAPSKPKTAPKPTTQAHASKSIAPKRSTRNIPAAEKNKAPVPKAQEDEEQQVLRKLKPKIPDHSDDHPVASQIVETDGSICYKEKNCC